MTSRTTRSRPIKLLAAASAAAFAVVAAPTAASADHVDPEGNLANANVELKCTAKLQKGFFPPALSADGTRLTARGQGNCYQGTNFDHGIVDIQKMVNGDWQVVGSTRFTTALQWTEATAPANTTGCEVYRSRSRVWRRADANKNLPTVAVSSASVYIGEGGLCDKF